VPNIVRVVFSFVLPSVYPSQTTMLKLKFDEMATPQNAQNLRTFLNTKLTETTTPDFIGTIEVTHLDLGSTAPIIALADIGEVFKDRECLQTSEGVSIRVAFKYAGDFQMALKIELVVNAPSPRFIVLPMEFKVSNIQLEGTHFCIICLNFGLWGEL
jgi:hypothetical protein